MLAATFPDPLDSVMFLQLRLGGDRRRAQARPTGHRAAGDHRVPRRVPRPDLRRAERHDARTSTTGPATSRCCRASTSRRSRRSTATSAATRPRRSRRRCAASGALDRDGDRAVAGRRDPHRAGPGRGRLQPGAARVPAGRCGRSATSTASCSSPTRSSRATGGPGGCGRSSTPGSSPTSCVVAKAIANGLPLSAIVSSRELQERWGRGAHGSTYGGNPVACAAGLAVLETIRDEGLVDNAAARGAELTGRPRADRGRGRPHRRRPRARPDDRRRVRARTARPASRTAILPDRLIAACADAGLLRADLRPRPRGHPLDPAARRHRGRDQRGGRDLRRDARLDAARLSAPGTIRPRAAAGP